MSVPKVSYLAQHRDDPFAWMPEQLMRQLLVHALTCDMSARFQGPRRKKQGGRTAFWHSFRTQMPVGELAVPLRRIQPDALFARRTRSTVATLSGHEPR